MSIEKRLSVRRKWRSKIVFEDGTFAYGYDENGILLDLAIVTADKYLNLYSKFVIPITDSSIRKGMELKLKYKKENLSYVDCVGYALALELGIKFLTGDQKFENKDNVEFVK